MDSGRTAGTTPAAAGGAFVRPDAQFRDAVTADGSSGNAPEPGRYHLYVSLACPWAHRTLIFRRLKNLEGIISVSVVEPVMSPEGWAFSSELPDHLYGCAQLHQMSHEHINPNRIVPLGPMLHFMPTHERARIDQVAA